MNELNPPDETPQERLSSRDAEQLVQHISDLSDAALPLQDGLRAAAAETDSRPLATALRQLAQQIEAGVSLEDALETLQHKLPAHLRSLVAAASQAGHIGEALAQIIEHHRAEKELRHSIFTAMAYPCLLLIMTFLLFVMMEFLFLGDLQAMIVEFGLEGYRSETDLWFLFGMLGAVPVIAVAFRLVLGAVWWRRLINTIPLIGALWYWMSVSQLTKLLSMLTEQHVPIPEALRVASQCARDANTRLVCRSLAEGADSGRPLSELISVGGQLPLALVPLVRWGERRGTLPDSLRTLSEMFAVRVRERAALLKMVLPPLVFVFVAIVISGSFSVVFTPLIRMITGLRY